jgi:PncC family amidohydrolase
VKITSLEEEVVSLLIEKSLSITTVESCTAGLIGATLVNVPGVSKVFSEGYITYSNCAKNKLVDVSRDTLEKYGAVSEEVAIEMAEGAARKSKADIAISATGIAGPDGGTPEKPVGLLYIGLWVKGDVKVHKFNFHGDRLENRLLTVESAFKLLIKELKGME